MGPAVSADVLLYSQNPKSNFLRLVLRKAWLEGLGSVEMVGLVSACGLFPWAAPAASNRAARLLSP